jgi:small subunit ribosomal protein S16
MLMIRLQRTGRKHEPTFRLVLTDSKNGPKSGKYLEVLGWFDSRIENKAEQIEVDRVKHWISKGAKLSDTVHNFLVSKKIIEGKKKNVLPKKSPIKKASAETPATPAPVKTEASPAVEGAPAEPSTAPQA